MKTCFVIGAGEFFEDSLDVRSGDMVIAADGGYVHLEKLGIVPDLIMGDFDSSEKPEFPNIAVFNSEKDDTDTGLCVEYGLENGFRDFRIYAGYGGRFDHTFANIQTLVKIAKVGGRGFIFGKDVVLTVISSEIEFDESFSGMISVFSVGDRAEGVCEEGLKYSLDKATLTNDFPLGVSNEFTGKRAKISVKEGFLLIVYERQ